MTFLTDSTCETYYDILNVKEDASYEEIRLSYRSALLHSHPDKLLNTFNNVLNAENNMEDRFMKVQKAWEILGDSRSRSLYDNKLRNLRNDVLVTDDVALEDMMVEDNGEALDFYYQCRCGDFYLISGSEFGDMGYELSRDEDGISFQTPLALPGSVILPCGSCSLRIRLLMNMNSRVHVTGKGVKG